MLIDFFWLLEGDFQNIDPNLGDLERFLENHVPKSKRTNQNSMDIFVLIKGIFGFGTLTAGEDALRTVSFVGSTHVIIEQNCSEN